MNKAMKSVCLAASFGFCRKYHCAVSAGVCSMKFWSACPIPTKRGISMRPNISPPHLSVTTPRKCQWLSISVPKRCTVTELSKICNKTEHTIREICIKLCVSWAWHLFWRHIMCIYVYVYICTHTHTRTHMHENNVLYKAMLTNRWWF